METGTFNLVTIFISGIALFFSIWSFHLSKKKRKDDLFEKRHSFYKRICKYWLSTSDPQRDSAQFDELLYYSEEANFLFGKGIKKHIEKLENKRNSNPMLVDDNFTKPFTKYLKL